MTIAENYARLRKELDEVTIDAGRMPGSVTLLAVSKTVDIPQVEEAAQAGARAFGENRPDELLRKKAALPQYEWHFIGNIQSRRIKDIVSAADVIHSVCKVEHLPKIDAAAKELGKVQPIFIEVNVSGEESKSGFAPQETLEVIIEALTYDNLSIRGLMTMAPLGDEEAARATFSGMAQLRAELDRKLHEMGYSIELEELSMGMTDDWADAVPFGSTIVRLGRAIFAD